MNEERAAIVDSLGPWLQTVERVHGETLFREGDPADGCYFIQRGVARVEMENAEIDTEPVLGYFGSGEVLGELAFLDGRPRSASVVAEEDLVAYKLSLEALAEAHAKDAALAAAVYKHLGSIVATRLREAHDPSSWANPDGEVDALVADATDAQREFRSWPDERVEQLLAQIATVAAQQAISQAQLAVEVTRLGNVEDKTQKNRMASLGVLESMRGKPALGVLDHDVQSGVSEIGDAMGVVFALVPQTNPVSTAVFKTLIALKSRNALILSFHRSAQRVAEVVGKMITETLADGGAPRGLVSWVQNRNSRRKTESFFRHPGISLILATGGSSMVQSAYSSGRPAIGVGPGNTPTLVCGDADLEQAANHIVLSKSFDNGLICGAEHNLVVVESVYSKFVAKLQAAGAMVAGPEESSMLLPAIYTPQGHMRRRVVGQSARRIAEFAGLASDDSLRLVVLPTEFDADGGPLMREKMAPVLSLMRVSDSTEGIHLCRALLELDGAGHSAAIHTASRHTMEQFAQEMPAGRILANTPAAHGVVGLTTGLVPSLTLGCGTFGGTSTTDNVTYTHLLNIKRLAEGRPPRVDITR